MRKSNQDFEDFCSICKANSFYKRGNSFFRQYGDGVLQVLQYKKSSRPYEHVDIKIGLFSLYGELEAQWLTSSGCIPRYTAHWLEPGVKESFWDIRSKRIQYMDDVRRVECYSINLSFLQVTLFPFLDQIQTQGQLADALMYLDTEASGPIKREIMWNDELKIAPFLHSGNLESAYLVVSAILNQHEIARQWRQQNWNREEYEESSRKMHIADANFYKVKNMIETANQDGILTYLQKNYQRNIQLAPFLR